MKYNKIIRYSRKIRPSVYIVLIVHRRAGIIPVVRTVQGCTVCTFSRVYSVYGSSGYGSPKPARGQLQQGKNVFFLSPFAPENLTSREIFDHPVPRQPTQAESGGAYPYARAPLLALSATASNTININTAKHHHTS